MTTRAKFRCEERHEKANTAGQVEWVFRAAYDKELIESEKAYAKYTPVGTLVITVDNPKVNFELGKFYYLDLTEAQE